MSRKPVKAGEAVTIKPEWRDIGDEKYTCIAVDDEEKGRVTIKWIGCLKSFSPTEVIHSDMIESSIAQ